MASYYLKFGDIDGDVTEPAYRTWIELKSWSWGVGGSGGSGNWGSGGSGGSGGSEGGISCIHEPDSASPALFQYCASGRHADAVIDMVRKSGGVFLRLEMSSARISSVQWAREEESLSIVSEKIERKIEPGTPPP